MDSPATYLEHVVAAQNALDFDQDLYPNPTYRTSIAQAHALVAIALLLEDLLAAVDQPQQPPQAPRIIGGLGLTRTVH